MKVEARGSDVGADAVKEAENHLKKATAYYSGGGRLEEVLKECDSAIHLDNSLADAHNLRGVALAGLGRAAEALGSFKKALEIEPGFLEARENLENLKAEFRALDNLVTVGAFNFISEMLVARMKLEAEGLWTFSADEETVTAAPQTTIAVGGIKLKVRAEDGPRALEILRREPGENREA